MISGIMDINIEHRIQEILKDDLLKQERHPDDERIIVTSHKDHFLAAARAPEYLGVIWRRDQKTVTDLSSAFKKTVELYGQKVFYPDPRAVFSHEENFTLQENGLYSLSQNPAIKFLKKELIDMAETFAMATHIKEPLRTLIIPGLNFPPHPHSVPVLNCTWLGKGTMWDSPNGKALQVEEGDWFLFQPGLWHYSPSSDGRHVVIIDKGFMPS
jgi:hypothetical protein